MWGVSGQCIDCGICGPGPEFDIKIVPQQFLGPFFIFHSYLSLFKNKLETFLIGPHSEVSPNEIVSPFLLAIQAPKLHQSVPNLRAKNSPLCKWLPSQVPLPLRTSLVPKVTPNSSVVVIGICSLVMSCGEMKLCVAPGSSMTTTFSPAILPPNFIVLGLSIPTTEFNDIATGVSTVTPYLQFHHWNLVPVYGT